jgi:predicted transcriptional regulator
MTKITLALSSELLDRLIQIAEQKDISLEDAGLQALLDYVESWEDFGRTVTLIETGEDERTVLRAVND